MVYCDIEDEYNELIFGSCFKFLDRSLKNGDDLPNPSGLIESLIKTVKQVTDEQIVCEYKKNLIMFLFRIYPNYKQQLEVPSLYAEMIETCLQAH